MREVRPWKKVDGRRVYEHRLFHLEEQHLEAQDGDRRDVVVFHPTDWINVIPLHEDRRVLMVRQWRYGIAAESLEIPGGMVDPGEDHATAARRELLEETGYRCDELVQLGTVEPNPAIQSNLCSLWLARSLECVGEPQGDGDEEITLEWVHLDDVPKLVRDGVIRHSLVIDSFYCLEHLEE